ncbi:RNA ligase (ATP) [Emticicia sp. C21]|uniref:RNA ligase (ATP) n=1 Tax=Emticicia sp. C21 TaxID=2302915 RepID=UPI000E343845|nr:RNA ligase (ATP) [Emticicia sp. C21]RFS13974.1 RNA ligase (ATP) [Emticicia sp. C21]
MRKLASIQRIIALEPIEGADNILKAKVLGWELVTKKDEFAVGDLCIYCEVDSLLPDKPEFEFLKSKSFRIKTIRLRGQISQGICFPLSFLPENFEIEEGADCTDVLGIIKYEPQIPANLVGIMKGGFPSFIPKTDETRVQILQNVLAKYKGEACYIAEKLDGSSATYYIRDGVFGVCSRNLEIEEDNENTYWKVAKVLNIEEKLRSLNGNYALQGELVGEGVQYNKMKMKGNTVFFFNLFKIDTFEYVSYADFMQLMKALELPTVPVLNDNFILPNSITDLVEMSKIKSTIQPAMWAEGIVIRLLNEKLDKTLLRDLGGHGRISFKVINPEFLLKFNE